MQFLIIENQWGYVRSARRDAARDDQIVLVVTSDGHVILQDRFGDFFFVGGANWTDHRVI